MSKRFTDTNKYKKPFVRSLPGAYKLLWDYLYHDCDHAGIWIVDFDIAQIYIGDDMPINKEQALKYFNNGEIRIVEFNKGSKWFIPSFVEFQYGVLSEDNRAHNSVIMILKKYNLLGKTNKPLRSSLNGAKDKDKDMDMDKDKDKDQKICKKINILPEFQDILLSWLKYKRDRRESYKTADSTELAYKKLLRLSGKDPNKAIKVIEQSMENNWAGLFPLKKGDNDVKPNHFIEYGKKWFLNKDGEYYTKSGELYAG